MYIDKNKLLMNKYFLIKIDNVRMFTRINETATQSGFKICTTVNYVTALIFASILLRFEISTDPINRVKLG